MPLNLPALRLYVSSLISHPSTLFPHLLLPSLLDLPDTQDWLRQTLSAQPSSNYRRSYPIPRRIRGLILDKDDTFTYPDSHDTTADHKRQLKALKREFKLLIVSNTAGVDADDIKSERLARETEDKFGIPVLRQTSGAMKPLCASLALKWFKDRNYVDHAGEICVIGDRIATDVVMGNLMGAYTCLLLGGMGGKMQPYKEGSINGTGDEKEADVDRGVSTRNGKLMFDRKTLKYFRLLELKMLQLGRVFGGGPPTPLQHR